MLKSFREKGRALKAPRKKNKKNKRPTDPFGNAKKSKQKNKTKNIRLNKFAQYFGLKDKPSSNPVPRALLPGFGGGAGVGHFLT